MKITQKILHYNVLQLKMLKKQNWNRPIKETHVAFLLANMNRCGYDQTSIVTIDKKSNSPVDGNHRIQAFIKYVEKTKQTKLTIPVQLVEFDTEEEMRDYILYKNNSQVDWSLLDYVYVYRKINDSYDKCDKLASVCPTYFYRKVGESSNSYIIDPQTKQPAVKYSAISALIFGKSSTDKIRKNTFNITNADIKTFYDNYNGLESIIQAVGWSQKDVAKRRYDMFAQTYVKFIKDYNITPEIMVKTIKKHKKLKDYLYNTQFTTKDGFREWFRKIDDVYHKRKV